MIAVDTNVVVYLFIEGELTAAARALREADPHWRLPPPWQHEYLNVLAAYVRSGGTDIATARDLWRTAVHLLADGECAVNMEEALDLAVTHGISAYDAQFVALAQTLRVNLITEDRRLLKRFEGLAIPLSSFARGLQM